MNIEHLVWLRNDLRCLDNPALYFASLEAGKAEQGIAVILTPTPIQWEKHNESDAKTGLRAGLIKSLANTLATLGIPLHIIDADTFDQLPEAITTFCLNHNIKHLWFNRDLPIHEQQRDLAVCEQLQQHQIHTHVQATDIIVPQDVLSQQGTPFKVFTPFFNKWISLLAQQDNTPMPMPEPQAEPLPEPSLNLEWERPFRDDLWPADHDVAKQKLWQFCHHKERHYQAARDYPIEPATSTLSPYLALGALGPRQCLEAVLYTCNQEGRRWQESIWLKELAWRDFYRQLMTHFPFLCMNRPFKPETDALVWRENEEEFQAWCEGRTGFPIVDAAMRQLNQTGWMHNRLRMVTASFFTKLMFADWRKGEAYFMSKLIDGEFAANNGGWQWSASTGCDAAPYFRVFNPTRQSQTYDESGDFIRRFVPELAKLDAKSIHDPKPEQRKHCHYPKPIIDYKSARLAAIAAFDAIKDR
ncbi:MULTISPECIES: deoxyribodipyrimidine photo-lyase [Marinomonas]|uniref:Deoxyribodipyrimidine photo-lyase n=1 Tax=Marinomonas arctica TaxID=383750 RepID=A0A7H1J8V4_9GAMM|nr:MULTISPECIES: deoxyribodipyrimidine photo-lyase [Marinomonas]MCS7487186.1 deoxyribodipyrimidine photolyase [Marinomonas sp. BSi20414]QNT06920.1 deoxyribodipyrimidine photo-lyase [Marinomonas arctica]GGN34081.1 deoxyribodipyrimidine photo-lyase [Marinomonas arctica]